MTTAENRLILQGFEWHTLSTTPGPHDTHSSASHYARLTRLLPSFADLGVTSLWLPPGCKGNNPTGNGYDVYDLFDLGEFDQKGARSTKWGSREELEDLLVKGRECGVEMIWDAILNHKGGADGTEECWAVEVDEDDRRYEICPPKKIEAWLRFDFHGRERDGELKYSPFRWRPEHFNGVDWDHAAQKNAIYKLIDDPSTAIVPFQPPKRPATNRCRSSGSFWTSWFHRSSISPTSRAEKQQPRPPLQRPGKGWAEDVDDEHGNYDYLMFSNIDYTHKAVRDEVTSWGRWMVDEVGVDGFRLDAAKHFGSGFAREFIQRAQDASKAKRQKNVFIIGEIWTGELHRITKWLDAVQSPTGTQVYAYDSPLLYSLSRLSTFHRKQRADLRTILHGSLLSSRPEAAVTLVTNHDTQPGQTSYTPMDPDMKPLFYAFILLRQEGLPCVFWGDLFGTRGPLAEEPISDQQRRPSLLATLMLARRLFAHGEQTDYWKGMDCIGWTRTGSGDRPGCAVLIAAGHAKRFYTIDMVIGRPGEVWVDILGNWNKEVTIDETGVGQFACCNESVGIWVKKGVKGTERFPVEFDVRAGD